MLTTMVTARRAMECDDEDDGNGRCRATKLTMMATAQQATKLTTMANLRQATNSKMMVSADDDNDNSVTTATTMAKATARRATATMKMMTMRRDANNEDDVKVFLPYFYITN